MKQTLLKEKNNVAIKHWIVTSENTEDTTTRHRMSVIVNESGGNTATVGGTLLRRKRRFWSFPDNCTTKWTIPNKGFVSSKLAQGTVAYRHSFVL